MRIVRLSVISVVAACTLACTGAAQELVITNARILDGSGGVIERGTIVVRDGRIVSVAAGDSAVAGAERIDAAGKTVMPGLVEGHRHLIEGDPTQWLANDAAPLMQQFLEAGFTTMFSAIDPTTQIVELRRRLSAGEIAGPRLLVGGLVQLSRAPLGGGGGDPARTDASRGGQRPAQPEWAIPEADTREAVRTLAAAGVDAIKTVLVTSAGGTEAATLAIVVDEARRNGLPTVTHAVTVRDTLAAVDAGSTMLVHTPHVDLLDEASARKIATAGIPMTSTLGVFVPYFNADNEPLFRDLEPFPWNTLSSAGNGPVNARLLWNAGITYAYGTDTSHPPRESLAHELRPLSLVFSPRDLVTILTRNAAIAIGLGDETGTLEAGKLADIIIINGDPLADIHAVLNVEVVIQAGRIVVDKR
jgi:imidazolonepropionase-like amidohydrolase